MNNYADPKERWKLLSQELALKQEVIKRAKQDLSEKNVKMKEHGRDAVKLREENFLLDQEVYELSQTLKIEKDI